MRVQKYLGLTGIVGITDPSTEKRVIGAAGKSNHNRCVGGWRRYQDGLAPLQTLLAEQTKAYEAPGRAILLSRL